jgi:hypothetical protein
VLELGEGARHGLDGQAQIVGHVLAAHGHVEQGLGARALGQVQQQGGDAFAGGAAAQHQHVVLAAAQAVGGQLQQPAGDVAALAGQGSRAGRGMARTWAGLRVWAVAR